MRWAAALLMLAASVLPAAGAEPEPAGYRGEPYRAPVPETLAGAVVVDDDAALALWRSGAVPFVDVLPRVARPPDLPPDTIWIDHPRASIPGSVWLPDTGYQALDPARLAYFLDALDALTSGDRSRPLLFFCKTDCWMSWNAAKRALEYGFSRVFWYPGGTDGWEAAGGALEPIEPQPVSR